MAGIFMDSMEAGAFGDAADDVMQFDTRDAGAPPGLRDGDEIGERGPDGSVKRLESGERGTAGRPAGESGGRGEQGQGGQQGDAAARMEEFARREAALAERESRLMGLIEKAQAGGGRLDAGGQPGGAQQGQPVQEPGFLSIEESMKEAWAELPADMKAALRAIDATNRANLERVSERIGKSGEGASALDQKIQQLEQLVTQQAERVKQERWASQAAVAREKYGLPALAPHAQKIAAAMQQFDLNVEDAIRLAAPEVYEAGLRKDIEARVRQQMSREFSASSLFGGSSGSEPVNLDWAPGESMEDSFNKVMMRGRR